MKKVQESGRFGERLLFLALCRKFSHLTKLKLALCDSFLPISLAIILKHFRLIKSERALPCLFLFLCFTFNCTFFISTAQEVVVLTPLKTNKFGACTDGLDLRMLLNPRCEGKMHQTGWWMVDGTTQIGDLWEGPVVGCHQISYVWQVTPDSVDSREVQLCIDKEPGVSVSLPRYVCEGEKAELRVALDGGAPFLLEYDVTRYAWGKYPTLYPAIQKIESTPYVETVGRLPEEDSLVYAFRVITDGHGCRTELSERHVVEFRSRREFELLTRYPHKTGVDWGVDKEFSIPRGDSLGVMVRRTKGADLWTLEVSEKSGMRGDKYEDIRAEGKILALKKGGRYDVKAFVAGICPDTKSWLVNVHVPDTVFVQLNLLLEGPYDKESGTMHTGSITLPHYGEELLVGMKPVDWVTVELLEGLDESGLSYRLVGSDTCLVLADGSVVDKRGHRVLGLDATNGGTLPNGMLSNRYYIGVTHRNHLGIMSRRLPDVEGERGKALLVDLTDSSKIYVPRDTGVTMASCMVAVGERDGRPVWAMTAGYTGHNLVSIASADEVALVGMEKGKASIAVGYGLYDLNMDGRVDTSDWTMAWGNRDRYKAESLKLEEDYQTFTLFGGSIVAERTEFCYGEEVKINSVEKAEVDGPAVYLWYDNGVLIAGAQGESLVYSLFAVGNHSIEREASSVDGKNVARTEPVSVRVMSGPDYNFSDDMVLCQGDEARAKLSFTGGTAPFRFRLTGDKEDRVVGTNEAVLSLCPTTDKTYEVVFVEDVKGCRSQSFIALNGN